MNEPLNVRVPELLSPEDYNMVLDGFSGVGGIKVFEFTRAELVDFARTDGWQGFLTRNGYDPERAADFHSTDGRWFVACRTAGVSS